MVYKWYCGKGVNASALYVNFNKNVPFSHIIMVITLFQSSIHFTADAPTYFIIHFWSVCKLNVNRIQAKYFFFSWKKQWHWIWIWDPILRAESFTFLMADLHQDVNSVSSFSRCLNGTFPWRNCESLDLFYFEMDWRGMAVAFIITLFDPFSQPL